MNASITFIVDAFNGVALPTQTAYPSIGATSTTATPSVATKAVSAPNATATGTAGNDGMFNAVPILLLAGISFFSVMLL